MAWLEQDRPNGPYQLVFRYGDERLKRSTRTKDEQEAEEIVTRVDRKLRLIEQGDIEIPSDADVITFLMSDGKQTQAPESRNAAPTLHKLIQQYFHELPDGAMEENSVATLHTHTKHLLKHLGGSTRLKAINSSSLQSYVTDRSRMPGRNRESISPTTIKKELASLSAIWTFARERGYVDKPLPRRGLKFPKTKEKPRFQTVSEIEAQVDRYDFTEVELRELWDSLYLKKTEIKSFLTNLEKNATRPFIYPMAVVAAHTGARRSELLRSDPRDFDFDLGVVTIRERKRARGRQTTRTIPMSKQVQTVMHRWLSGHPGCRMTFFDGQTDGDFAPVTKDQAHDHFKRSLPRQWARMRGWHVLRHSFASNCASAGVDQRLINAWMGHQTEDMVRRYQHLLPDKQASALRSVF